MREFDTAVIGGGPAGLAAALSARENGASVVLIEREEHLGGMLKQCIHDGFGLQRFGEKLTGPEYAERFIDKLCSSDITVLTQTFVTEIKRPEPDFEIVTVSRSGIEHLKTKTIVLATGCRERTAKQVSIHGTRPAGIFTAGTAQNFINRMGLMPAKRCVILGSGDIGLIMARRLTLEGAEVIGVYEINPVPSGLRRNIYQCLDDFDIPLHLSHTVTRVFGDERLTGVEVCAVDENRKPVPGTEERIDCDGLIVSVGLIPENELAESIGIELDRRTGGPLTDGQLMSSLPGVFSCGNCLHVNDLVDYVSMSGEEAGRNAALYSAGNPRLTELEVSDSFLYLVPRRINLECDNSRVSVYFRSRNEVKNCRVSLKCGGRELWGKNYPALRPGEMQKLSLDMGRLISGAEGKLGFEIEVRQ